MYIFFHILIMVYYRLLNIVPCAIQQDIVVFPIHMYRFASMDPKLTIQPAPLATTGLFSMSVNLFLFCR